MQKSGWNLFQFRPFALRLKALTQDVVSLAQSDPTGYKQHPKTKLLASVYRSITETVPANPADPVFRLGHTLGKQNGNWRRVKKGLPQRTPKPQNPMSHCCVKLMCIRILSDYN